MKNTGLMTFCEIMALYFAGHKKNSVGETQVLSTKVFYCQLMNKRIVFKRVLKFTLKLQ